MVLALASLTMSAQDESKFTLKAGVGLSSVVGSDANTKTVFAYKVGIAYDWNVSGGFYVIPGFEFATKGFKAKNVSGTIGMSYLQIPVFAAYKFKLNDNMKLGIKTGPYIAYGIFGSDIDLYYENGKKESINVFDSDKGYKRFDAGVIAGVSLDISQISIGFEYSRGLTKLDSDYKQYNQAYGLVFGYRF